MCQSLRLTIILKYLALALPTMMALFAGGFAPRPQYPLLSLWASEAVWRLRLRCLGLTRFRGHPEAFARGVPDAQRPTVLFA